MRTVLDEMTRIRDSLVTPAELTGAKDAIINSFVFRFTSRFSVVTQLLTLEFDEYPPDYLDTLLDRYRAVTSADVQRVARQYLRPDETTVLVVGDTAQIEPAMAAFGPVTRLPVPAAE